MIQSPLAWCFNTDWPASTWLRACTIFSCCSCVDPNASWRACSHCRPWKLGVGRAVSRLKYVSLCWNGKEWLYDECQIVSTVAEFTCRVNTRSCHTHTGFGTPQHWQIRDGTVNYRFHGDVFKMHMWIACNLVTATLSVFLFASENKIDYGLRVHYISTTVRGKSFADCQWWTLGICSAS
jgi:hypothetical protein